MSGVLDGSNGPTQAEYFRHLGVEIDYVFQRMRLVSKSGHNQRAWEARGGDREQIQLGRKLAKLTPDERRAKVASTNQVHNWEGLVKEEAEGQFSFAAALQPGTKAGGEDRAYPLGSAPSLGLAKIDGYQSGKRGALNLADNPWPDDAQECGVWAEAFGMGMEDRPPPKPSKTKADAADPEGDDGEDTADEAPKPAKRGRGRPAKSATQEMAERAAAMPATKSQRKGQKALAAPAEDDKPGWQSGRDFSDTSDESLPEPPAAVH